MKNKYQVRILINLFNPRKPEVEFEHRNETLDNFYDRYSTKAYTPTKTSMRRLDKTITRWVNKNQATLTLNTPLIEIEPTA